MFVYYTFILLLAFISKIYWDFGRYIVYPYYMFFQCHILFLTPGRRKKAFPHPFFGGDLRGR